MKAYNVDIATEKPYNFQHLCYYQKFLHFTLQMLFLIKCTFFDIEKKLYFLKEQFF